MKRLFLLGLLFVVPMYASQTCRLEAISEETVSSREGDRAGGVSPKPVKPDFGVVQAIVQGNHAALKEGLSSFSSVWEKGLKPTDRTMNDDVVDPVTNKSMSLIGFAVLNTALESRAFGNYPKTIIALLQKREELDGKDCLGHFRKILEKDRKKAFPQFVQAYDAAYGVGAYDAQQEAKLKQLDEESERHRRTCFADVDSGRLMA